MELKHAENSHSPRTVAPPTSREQKCGAAGDWWRNAVIYQIYPRSFQDSNGNGTGDLRGIARRMDYIEALGVDAIWISPFYKSPMKDFGYDVSDYRAVDPLFGDLDDFDALLAQAHGRGIRIIIDQVLSHTSDRHPWFLESREDRDNDKADWYVWADAKPDGSPPNNWLSVFGGVAWQWEPRRGQYYLHNFLASQPDLNCHNPAVRQAGLENLEFWLKRGVDGFRLDAVNFCMHDPKLRDNPPISKSRNEFLAGGQATSPYAMQTHVHDHTHPDNLLYIEEIRQLLDRYGAVALGEIGSERSAEVIGEYTRGHRRLHMAYSFDLMGPDGSARAIKRTLEGLQKKAGGGWCCFAIGNHDVERVASRWTGNEPDAQSAKLFSILLGSLRGAVCIYQGDELGLPQAEVPFERLQDPYGINFWPVYKGRDGCRTPMPWQQHAPFAGFSSASPWLPLDQRHLALAADRQQGDPDSVYECIRAFLHFRKRQPALLHGALDFLPVQQDVLTFSRSADEQTLLLSFNLNGEERAIGLEQLDALNGRQLERLDVVKAPQGSIANGELVLPPRSMLIAEVR
ncbi:MAG: DUF3459 domain-containing protein [Gammaproteobacteria bacterium]|nr:DUF3459 domain-containing protein [Gammaproteobacteria bacterium]MYE30381.1 DUF3459 domain-containing protein [Gammaproteobacteria bacterium]MYI02495.1 DUF3459 domain-containing protein [Gammaproteobacteria bacterium]